MARKKEYDLEHLKEGILNAAREIAVKKGYHELNVRDIATAVGCSIGTIYNAFKNIYDIVLHINGETLDLLKETLERELKKSKERVNKGKAIGKIYISFTRNYLSLWNLLFEYQHPQNEPLPRWYQNKIDHMFSILETNIAPQFSGDKKKLRRMTRALWAGLHGICVLEVGGKLKTTKSETPEKLWDALYKLYLAGVKMQMNDIGDLTPL